MRTHSLDWWNLLKKKNSLSYDMTWRTMTSKPIMIKLKIYLSTKCPRPTSQDQHQEPGMTEACLEKNNEWQSLNQNVSSFQMKITSLCQLQKNIFNCGPKKVNIWIKNRSCVASPTIIYMIPYTRKFTLTCNDLEIVDQVLEGWVYSTDHVLFVPLQKHKLLFSYITEQMATFKR